MSVINLESNSFDPLDDMIRHSIESEKTFENMLEDDDATTPSSFDVKRWFQSNFVDETGKERVAAKSYIVNVAKSNLRYKGIFEGYTPDYGNALHDEVIRVANLHGSQPFTNRLM